MTLAIILFPLLLSACAPLDQSAARIRSFWADLAGSASGSLVNARRTAEDSVSLGKQALSEGRATLQEIQDRAAKVEEGAKKVEEGKKLIEEGVGRGE